MCIICSSNNVNELINLTFLECNNCPLITEIPKEFVNLTNLNCPGSTFLYLTDSQKQQTKNKNHVNISEPKYTKPFLKMIKTFRKNYIAKKILNYITISDISNIIVNFL